MTQLTPAKQKNQYFFYAKDHFEDICKNCGDFLFNQNHYVLTEDDLKKVDFYQFSEDLFQRALLLQGGVVIKDFCRKREIKKFVNEQAVNQLSVAPFYQIDWGHASTHAFLEFCREESPDEEYVLLREASRLIEVPELQKIISSSIAPKQVTFSDVVPRCSFRTVWDMTKEELEEIGCFDEPEEYNLQNLDQADLVEMEDTVEEQQGEEDDDEYGRKIYNRNNMLVELTSQKISKMKNVCFCQHACTCPL